MEDMILKTVIKKIFNFILLLISKRARIRKKIAAMESATREIKKETAFLKVKNSGAVDCWRCGIPIVFHGDQTIRKMKIPGDGKVYMAEDCYKLERKKQDERKQN